MDYLRRRCLESIPSLMHAMDPRELGGSSFLSQGSGWIEITNGIVGSVLKAI